MDCISLNESSDFHLQAFSIIGLPAMEPKLALPCLGPSSYRPVARNFQVGVLSLTVLAWGESVTQTGG